MDKIPEHWKVEKAQEKHISAIVAIARYYDMNRLLQGEQTKRGFLVSSYSVVTYHRFLTKCDHFYVALDQDSVIGFMLAFSRDLIPESDWVGTQLKHRESKPFILSKQLAISPTYVGRGVGTCMYRYLFDKCSDVSIMGAIVLEPLNERSVRFHESLGFEKIWEATPPDGTTRGVWCRVTKAEIAL